MKLKRLTDPNQLLLIISFLVIFFSLVTRFAYRKDFVPGWDLMGQSQGQFFLETQGIRGLFDQAIRDTRHYQYWTPISSFIYTFIPGQLGIWFPWLHWGGVLNLLAFALFPWLIIKISNLEKRDYSFLFLAFAASPALLSFALTNYPYNTGCLPHLLVLAMIFSPWFRERPLWNLIAGGILGEISLHLYPLGRTFFINLFLFSILDRKAKMKLRIAWLVTALVSVGFTYWAPAQMSANTALSLKHFSSFGLVFKSVFIEARYDHVLILWAGLLSCFLVKRERLPLVLMFLGQWWLILTLVSSVRFAELRSRRLLVTEVYGLILFCFFLKDRAHWLWRNGQLSKWGKGLLWIFVFGAGYQCYDLFRFTRTPITQRIRPLPYVDSQADYYIAPVVQTWNHEIIQRARSGKTIVLLYDFLSYPENTTDPRGLLEELYLKLGHRAFSEKILIFCQLNRRYSRVPILDVKTIDTKFQELKNDSAWQNVEIWNFKEDARNHVAKDHPEIMKSLKNHFDLLPIEAPFKSWEIFKLNPMLN